MGLIGFLNAPPKVLSTLAHCPYQVSAKSPDPRSKIWSDEIRNTPTLEFFDEVFDFLRA